MTTPGGETQVGLMLLRKATLSQHRDGRNPSVPHKLQMLFLETYKGELTLPAEKRGIIANDKAGAETAAKNILGLSSTDFDVFDMSSILYLDKTHKIIYWVAFLHESKETKNGFQLLVDRSYKTYHWVDYAALKSKVMLASGRMNPHLGPKLADFVGEHEQAIEKELKSAYKIEL